MTASAPGGANEQPWATVQIVLRDPSPDAAAIDRLDALGLMLAGHEGVGGVERRDAGTLVDAQVPELWVYTTPPGIEAVQARVAALAGAVNLSVDTTVEIRQDDDWRESWKQFYPPRILGAGALLLRPSWVQRRPDDPQREVVLDPGRAFGTGLHESTRLCLDRLCQLFADGEHPATVLDLGCGSGILGLAAARLFPDARLWAADFDPEAVETTRENIDDNELGARFDLQQGTVESVQAPACALVIANIRPEVLVPGAAAIAALVEPGGRVLLSGILVEEADAVRAAYVAQGLRPVHASAVLGEWQAVELRAP